jgi:serine/threonine protein kinase
MLYCLNPTCSHPENHDNHINCHGCGEALATSTQSYLFRVHYRITKCLGEGAFGRTYLADDTDLMDEPRVIKKLIAGTSGAMQSKIRELFLREAKQLYNLNHPQIPKLYAYFEQNNVLYLVQEFIEGDNLFQEFSHQGIFSEEKIKSLLQDLLPVLDYLHSNKIIHRDIKPQNIMRCQKNGKLILIDFGGAKQTCTSLQSQPGTMLYTPGYAAVEHMMGQPCPASDIYSLGATCIRLLTGCFPINDEFGNLQDELYDRNNLEWQWREYLQK